MSLIVYKVMQLLLNVWTSEFFIFVISPINDSITKCTVTVGVWLILIFTVVTVYEDRWV